MATEAAPVGTAATQPAKQIPIPTFERGTRLGLAKRTGIVKVGADIDSALGVFTEPPGSYEKTDLPPSIPNTFEARGWQKKDEGFGMILYKGRVVGALYQLDRATPDRLDELIKFQQDAFGAPTKTLPGKYVRYWFWIDGQTEDPSTGQILMVCATEAKLGKLSISAAVGWQPIMDALGMSWDAATRDQVKAEKLIDKQRSGGKTNTANSANREAS